ncbi:MAG TPA: DUF4349 domain-containing protein [Polyangia bacterium]|jgi:hypothetical protein
MRGTLRRGLLWFAILFGGMFALRLGYGYAVTRGGGDDGLPHFGGAWESRKNYASLKGGAAGAPAAGGQKYEKIATLRSHSRDFGRDEQALRAAVPAHHGLIQFEQSAGLPGRRALSLAIGVPPEQFDPLLARVRQIGHLAAIEIHKADKTNEYKGLAAQRASLEKARAALVGLKARGGKLDELMGLEDKILDVEGKIQQLGVKLGEYDVENELITVRVSLEEQRAHTVPLLGRVRTAAIWTVTYGGLLVALGLATVLTTLLGLAVMERLRRLPVFARRD